MTSTKQVLLRLDSHVEEWLTSVSYSKRISKQDLIKAMISDFMIGAGKERLDDIVSDISNSSDSSNSSSASTELADIKQDIIDIKSDIVAVNDVLSSSVRYIGENMDATESRLSELESSILELRSLLENKPKRGRPSKKEEKTLDALLIPDSDSLC